MIKAEELRIGNYVNYIYDGLEFNIVTGVDTENIFLNNVTFDHVEFEEVEPIPLTEEWLIKFGLKDDGFGFENEEMYLDLQDGVFSIYLGKDIILDYVHQFQNLIFALTGKELTIKE